jgi:nicotinate-nucleotide adenylyltransferase
MDPQSSSGSRVAFFGGTFDPPHLGHLGVARAARAALGLDLVLFAPVGAQPLKPQGTVASFEHRMAMTRLAIASDPAFALSLADAPQPSGAPNYTLETLLALRAQLPPSSALFCLMGADSFASFRRWHRAAEIPFIASLIVASRPSESPWSLDTLNSALPAGLVLEAAPESDTIESEIPLRRFSLRNPAGQQAPFYLLPGLHIEISASQIRDQFRSMPQSSASAPNPDRDLLSPPVLEYIRAHNLYL